VISARLEEAVRIWYGGRVSISADSMLSERGSGGRRLRGVMSAHDSAARWRSKRVLALTEASWLGPTGVRRGR
jgi:hypothetical protein